MQRLHQLADSWREMWSLSHNRPWRSRRGIEVSSTVRYTGVGGQRHAPRRRVGIHCTGGWVGPRAGLDGYGKSRPHRDSFLDRLARREPQYRLSYRITAHQKPAVYGETDVRVLSEERRIWEKSQWCRGMKKRKRKKHAFSIFDCR
jgi:hypothetical protein